MSFFFEISLFFYRYGKFSESELNQKVAKNAQKMFIDFIKTGSSFCLQPYNNETRSFCEINSKGLIVKNKKYHKGKNKMNRWDAWISTVPNGWPTFGKKYEYATEPTLSWFLNELVLTELIMLTEDLKRMVVYGGLVLYLGWKISCCCCCGGGSVSEKTKEE